MTDEELLTLAVTAFEAGQLDEAERRGAELARRQPESEAAWQLLGLVALQQNRIEAAVERLSHFVRLAPTNAEAHNTLGVACQRKGDTTGALAEFQTAVGLSPHYPAAQANLGRILIASGRYAEAVPALQAAVTEQPVNAALHRDLGGALHRAGRPQEAIAAFLAALTGAPDDLEARQNLGIVLAETGAWSEAEPTLRAVLQRSPRNLVALCHLADVLAATGRLDEAIQTFRGALALDPNHLAALNNLGNLLQQSGDYGEAIALFRAALRVDPASAAVRVNLARVLQEQGQVEDAIATYRAALTLAPDLAAAHTGLLLSLHYDPRTTAAELAREHRRWAERRVTAPASHAYANSANPERPLRVGFVSPDFWHHPVARFLLPLFREHDRARFEFFAYANSRHRDGMSLELHRRAAHWRDVTACTDSQFAHQVRADRIDILIDLAGHTSGSRLSGFASKPAPIQVSYLGYPDTTGLPAIDYRVVDPWSDPPGLTDPFCTEELWRLPTCAWCYSPPSAAPSPAVTERLTRGAISFGSFNTLAKLSAPLVAWWAALLRELPASRLVLKAKALTDRGTRRVVEQRFAAHGIATSRLLLLPWARTIEEHIAQYAEIDLALDSFPFHGTTTTCDALWMGVPVVTLAGDMHHSRVGVSLLHQVGLDACVAHSPSDYVRRAAELARDPTRLGTLHGDLRARMAASPLRDERGFTAEFETMLRAMWRRWCVQGRG